jgi:hypothetical protein
VPRVIRLLEQKAWLDNLTDQPDLLQADALKNFKTQSNKLSIFKIVEEGDGDNVLRILVAYAATRDNVDKVDYAIFEERVLQDLEIQKVVSIGATADDLVNSLHMDLVDLTGQTICYLAARIQREGNIERINKREVESALRSAKLRGYLQAEKINHTLSAKLM